MISMQQIIQNLSFSFLQRNKRKKFNFEFSKRQSEQNDKTQQYLKQKNKLN